MRAEGRQHRVGPGDGRSEHLGVGRGEIGGDDPRGPVREDAGELGGVAGYRGDVVPGLSAWPRIWRPTPPLAAMIVSFMMSSGLLRSD